MPLLTPIFHADFARSGAVHHGVRLVNAGPGYGSYIRRDGVMQPKQVNGARITHDPDTYRPRGLLIEGPSANKLLNSDLFTSTWVTTELGLAQWAAPPSSPDGGAQTWRLTPTAVLSAHVLRQDATIVADTVNTFSIWVRAASLSKVKLELGNTALTNVISCVFDAALGTKESVVMIGAATLGTARMKLYRRHGNWWRIRVSGKIDAASTTARCRVAVLDASGAQTYTGDGTSYLLAFGGNLEERSEWSSYIATGGSTVSTLLDTVTFPNFTDWFNGSGTAIIEATIAPSSVSQVLWSVHLDSSNRTILEIDSTGMMRLSVSVAAVFTILNLKQLVFNEGNEIAVAARIANNNFAAISRGGTLQTSAVPVALTTHTEMRLGSRNSGLGPMYGEISRFSWYPALMNNDELDLYANQPIAA